MAEYTVPAGHIGIHEKQLSAGVVDTVVFEGVALHEVEILTDGAANIYVQTGPDADPSVKGTDCYRIPPFAGSVTVAVGNYLDDTVVRLVSAGAPVYSVARS